MKDVKWCENLDYMYKVFLWDIEWPLNIKGNIIKDQV